jgi:hypothetical protein
LDSRPYIFLTEPLRSWSLCDILFDEQMGSSLMNMLGLCQVYLSHLCRLLKILTFALYKSPLSVHAFQSRSCLSYVSYAITAA